MVDDDVLLATGDAPGAAGGATTVLEDSDREEGEEAVPGSRATKSSRRAQRRRRRRAEAASPTKANVAPTPAPQKAAASDASTTSGSPGNASLAWSEEDDSALADDQSRRASGDSNSSVAALPSAPLTGPLLSTGGTTPVAVASRNVVTWSDLLGGSGKNGSAKSPAGGDAGLRTAVLQPPFTAAGPLSSQAVSSPLTAAAQETWDASWAALHGVVWSQPWEPPPPPTHWAGYTAGGVPIAAGYHNEDALRSWLNASGLPCGQLLAAELKAVAPEAYED